MAIQKVTGEDEAGKLASAQSLIQARLVERAVRSGYLLRAQPCGNSRPGHPRLPCANLLAAGQRAARLISRHFGHKGAGSNGCGVNKNSSDEWGGGKGLAIPRTSLHLKLTLPLVSPRPREMKMACEGLALVTGAGGFIGHHLIKHLAGRGWQVRGADLKLPEYEEFAAHDFMVSDLRSIEHCVKACKDVDRVYHLAADMGGIGYITSSHAEIAINNALINTHMMMAARQNGVKRFLFSSSACISSPISAEGCGRRSPQGGGCVSGRPGRGIWARKALHGETVPVCN